LENRGFFVPGRSGTGEKPLKATVSANLAHGGNMAINPIDHAE
jgi:hypothetical protein